MKEKWEFFPCRMGDGVGTVLYNKGIGEVIDELAVDQSVRFFLEFNSPTQDGLPGEADAEPTNSLEDQLDREISKRGGCYTGRITLEGRRIYYSYVDAKEAEIKRLAKTLGKEFGYELGFDTRNDPDKEDYWRDLYPSPEMQEYIKNQLNQDIATSKMSTVLKGSGIKVNDARRIDHWVAFTAKAKMKKYATWVAKQGFEIESEASEKSDDGFYELQFYRSDVPEDSAMKKLTSKLTKEASKLGGTYSGYEVFLLG